MDNKFEVGPIIREYRKRFKLSQQQLELAIDASFGSISRIEAGKVNPTKETLQKISDALKLSDEEKGRLFGIEGEEEEEDLSYIVREFIGNARIKYNSDPDCEMDSILILKFVDETCDFDYYVKNPTTKLKFNEGVIGFNNRFYNLHEFPKWNGNITSGAFTGLSKITLKANRNLLKKEHLIRVLTKQCGHFVELVEGMNETSHYFGFRMIAPTDKVDITFEFDKGKKSILTRLEFSEIHMYKELQKKILQINFNRNLNKSIESLGECSFKDNADSFIINWKINRYIRSGNLLRLTWYTAHRFANE